MVVPIGGGGQRGAEVQRDLQAAAVAQAVPAQVQLPQLTPRAAVVGKGPRPPPAATALELAGRPPPPCPAALSSPGSRSGCGLRPVGAGGR